LTTAAFLGALALACLFAMTSARHVIEPWRMRTAVRDAGIPEILSVAATGVEAGLVPVLALAPRLGAWLAFVYLAAITTVFATATWRGMEIADCGCMRRPHRVDRSYHLRNVALLAASGLVALSSPAGDPVIGMLGGAVFASCVVAGLTARRRVPR
jgi:Methylamine utilisation protein MauE